MKLSALLLLLGTLAASSSPTNYTVGGKLVLPPPVPVPTLLAYHLATNIAAHTVGHAVPLTDMAYTLPGWDQPLAVTNDYRPVWNPNFWMSGVIGQSATVLAFTIQVGLTPRMYVYPFTMVSPRHYLRAAHVSNGDDFWHFNPGSKTVCALFADDHAVYYRHFIQETNDTGADANRDIGVGMIDEDLPASVGFLPVLPADYTSWIPAWTWVQGLGMNQDRIVFACGVMPWVAGVSWQGNIAIPNGVGTNWTTCADPLAVFGGTPCSLRNSDSSSPIRLLIGNQLVLVSAGHGASGGPDYAKNMDLINARMHYLSTNNGVVAGSARDYQLTPISLTNWAMAR